MVITAMSPCRRRSCLNCETPNHSVLSNAKWAAEVFRSFIERIILQCMEAGLVDGRKAFVDSSLLEADASNKSVVDTTSLTYHLRKDYETPDARLEEQKGSADASGARKENDHFIFPIPMPPL